MTTIDHSMRWILLRGSVLALIIASIGIVFIGPFLKMNQQVSKNGLIEKTYSPIVDTTATTTTAGGGGGGSDVNTDTRSSDAPIVAATTVAASSSDANANTNTNTNINTGSPKVSMRLPNLLIAGAQKGGTTSLAGYLTEHGYACQSHNNTVKEPHFYGRDFTKGIEYYREIFRGCMQGNNTKYPYIMDATTDYLNIPEIIHDTYEADGLEHQVKIIFTLREPVAREISWFHHRNRSIMEHKQKKFLQASMLYKDGKPKSFETVMEESVLRSFKTSNFKFTYGVYAFHLKKWFNLFDRQNILVLSYDEMKANQTSLLERIHKFLELPITAPLQLNQLNARPPGRRLQTRPKDPPCAIQNKIAGLFETPNNNLYALLDKNPGPDMEQRPFPRFNFSCSE